MRFNREGRCPQAGRMCPKWVQEREKKSVCVREREEGGGRTTERQRDDETVIERKTECLERKQRGDRERS